MYKLFLAMTLGFFLFILWIVYLANTGQSSLFFDLVRVIPYGDKPGHLMIFGVLTLGGNLVFKFKSIRLGKINFYAGSLFVMIFVPRPGTGL